MRRLMLAATFLLGAGVAWAAQTALVVASAPTYDAGAIMPMTLTTGGALRVDCN